jgi:hypothetical protein
VRVKSGEIFAANLSKTGWSGAGALSQDLIRTGKRSELLTRIATKESVLDCPFEIHKPSPLLPTESFLSDPSDGLIADDF